MEGGGAEVGKGCTEAVRRPCRNLGASRPVMWIRERVGRGVKPEVGGGEGRVERCRRVKRDLREEC